MSEPAPIPLAVPFLAGNERQYVLACLETNYVSSVGPFVERFEREFAAYVGARHAVACASGTAALHVAMRLLDVQAGDEVIVPSLTFIASANPVRYQGATVVLADSEPQTWNLDPEMVEAELRRRAKAGLRQPKAVMAVHLLGRAALLEPLVGACEHYGVPLVEDAAEALGARYTTGSLAGRQVGTVGRIGCFSFNGNKLITTGGGGMLVTDDPALARRAKHLTTQAKLPGLAYDHDQIGYNYRLTNLAAAMGVAQLEQIDDLLGRKAASAARYDAAFADLPGIHLPVPSPVARDSHWLYSVQMDSPALRDRLLDSLTAGQIQARPVWTPLHRMAPYADAPRLGGAVADRLADNGISLPSSAGLSRPDQDRVIATVRSVLASAEPASRPGGEGIHP